MLLQWSAPEYMPHSFQVSGLSGTVGHKQTGNCFDLTKQVADGFVGMQELSKGLFLVQSEMAFKRETELYEEYPERKVFQLSFCMNGICEWDYRQKQGEHYQLSPTQCSLQCGTFSQCVSHFGSEQPYHTLSISLEEGRFSSLTEDLEAAHLIRRDDKICIHVFSTTPEIRLVLQQLLDCPPERKLRKLYLEGKVLELLSLFCDEAVCQAEKYQRYFQRRLPMLDESEGNYRQSFPPSLTIAPDCRTMFFERNQIETRVQNLF